MVVYSHVVISATKAELAIKLVKAQVLGNRIVKVELSIDLVSPYSSVPL